MKIADSGASGFIGKRLSAFLELQGHQIVPLGRAMFRDNMSDQLIARLSQCKWLSIWQGQPSIAGGQPNIKGTI